MKSTEGSVLDIWKDAWEVDIKEDIEENAEKNIIVEEDARSVEEDIKRDIKENILKNISKGISSGIPKRILRRSLSDVLKDVLKNIPRSIPLNIPRESLIELFKQHPSLKKVSEELNVSTPTVRRKLLSGQIMSISVFKKTLGIIGTSHTAKKNFLILDLYNKLGSYAEVGRRVNLSRERIRQIVNEAKKNSIITANVANIEKHNRAIRQKGAYEKYIALVREIGEHPTSQEILSKKPGLYGAIWHLWGGIKNFRERHGISREKNRPGRKKGEI